MLGVALINECISNGDTVLAIAREGSARLDRLPKHERVHVECADLNSLESIKGDGNPYDVFYHFAWGYTAKNERDLPLAQENNIRTALEAVNLAKKLGCVRFVGAGSQAEYGKYSCTISEDMPAAPISAYGIAKYSACMLSSNMCKQLGIKHIWARVFSVYGCNDNEGTMLNYAIDQFMEGKVAYFSAATQDWNYLFETDAGRLFYLLGSRDIEDGIYNVAGNETKPLRQYIKQVATKFENSKCEFASEVSAVVYGIRPSTDKCYRVLDYTPQVSFDEGIERVIAYRRNR